MVPKHRFRKFAVVSDRQRYDELVAQRGETSVWCRRPTPGFEVSDPEVFTLEQFTIDGVDVTFQRYADSTSQVYVVDLGDEVIRAGKPVVVTFRFCAAAPVAGHSFHLSIDRPTKDLDVELRYDPDVVGQVSLMDFASRGDGGRISDEPDTSALRYRYEPAWSSSGRSRARRLLPGLPRPRARPNSFQHTTELRHPRKTTPAG